MLEIPEYLMLRSATNEGCIVVSFKMDQQASIPKVTMDADVVAKILDAFLKGSLAFMSFDEHPMRLTKVTLTYKERTPHVALTARTPTEVDDFPNDWIISPPEVFGACCRTEGMR